MLTDLRSSSWEEARRQALPLQLEPVPRREADRGHGRRRGAGRARGDVKVELTKPAKKDCRCRSRRLLPDPALDRADRRGAGRQDAVPRRSLRRLGEGREGLRHRRPSSAGCRPPGGNRKLPAGEERRAPRRGRGLAGLDRLLRARLRQEGRGAGLRAVRSCSSRTASAASSTSTTASSPSGRAEGASTFLAAEQVRPEVSDRYGLAATATPRRARRWRRPTWAAGRRRRVVGEDVRRHQAGSTS